METPEQPQDEEKVVKDRDSSEDAYTKSRNAYNKRLNRKKARYENALTVQDLRTYALLKYGTWSEVGRALGGVTSSMALQYISGYSIPKKPDLILRIAAALGINPLTVQRIFNDLKGGRKVAEDKK